MIKKISSLFFLIGLFLSACLPDSDEAQERDTLGYTPFPPVQQTISTAAEVSATSTSTSSDGGEIHMSTDRETYVDGETLFLSIENASEDVILFMASCSPNLCINTGEDWICVERECAGQPAALAPEEKLVHILNSTVIPGAKEAEVKSRYKLDYQVADDEPYYFAYSNEFVIQNNGLSCRQARQTAVDIALSSPYSQELDFNRTAVSWQADSQTCQVDIAWQTAEAIRPGLWSEGYSVLVDAKSGKLLEANPYER